MNRNSKSTENKILDDGEAILGLRATQWRIIVALPPPVAFKLKLILKLAPLLTIIFLFSPLFIFSAQGENDTKVNVLKGSRIQDASVDEGEAKEFVADEIKQIRVTPPFFFLFILTYSNCRINYGK